jgi:hypothetical protein
LLVSIFGFDDSEVGWLCAAKEDVEVQGNAFEAEQVVAVGADLDLKLWGFLLAIDNRTLLLLGVFVELDTIVKAEVLKLLLGEPLAQMLAIWTGGMRGISNRDDDILAAQGLEELVFINGDGRHVGG